MKFIAAIDWKSSFKCGFNFVELEAKNIKDAMIEAPAKAAEYCKRVVHLEWDLENVYDLHLLTQTKAQAADAEANNTFKYYQPVMHTWLEDEQHILDRWSGVYTEKLTSEK